MPDLPFSHMGAIITDAIFQGGIQYATVEDWRNWVRSRQETRTTSGFLKLLDQRPQAFYGSRRNQRAAWVRKANLMAKVARLLAKWNGESEEALKASPGPLTHPCEEVKPLYLHKRGVRFDDEKAL